MPTRQAAKNFTPASLVFVFFIREQYLTPSMNAILVPAGDLTEIHKSTPRKNNPRKYTSMHAGFSSIISSYANLRKKCDLQNRNKNMLHLSSANK